MLSVTLPEFIKRPISSVVQQTIHLKNKQTQKANMSKWINRLSKSKFKKKIQNMGQ